MVGLSLVTIRVLATGVGSTIPLLATQAAPGQQRDWSRVPKLPPDPMFTFS